MYRVLRSLLSYSRYPFRYANETGTIYRVRFVPKERRLNGLTRAFLWFGGFQVAANGLLQIYGTSWEAPMFIPLGFAEYMPERPYSPEEPEYQAYVRFKKDPQKALEGKRRVLEMLTDYLNTRYGKKFGQNIHIELAAFYYHYPPRPREYKRKGLRISPPYRDPSHPDSILSSTIRVSNLNYAWVERPIPNHTMHRLMTALYPYWMFSSLCASLQHTCSWLSALEASGETVESLGGPVGMGKRAITHGLHNGLRHLGKTYKRPPVPQGHVILDGLVQVCGDNLRVAMDITASFDPETFAGITFHRIEIRYVARNTRLQPIPPPPTLPLHSVKPAPKNEIIQAAAALQRSNVDKARSFLDKQEQERRLSKKKKEDDSDQEVPPVHSDPEKKPEDEVPVSPDDTQGANEPDVPPSPAGPNEQNADIDDAASKP